MTRATKKQAGIKPPKDNQVRIHKILSNAGLFSRRKAEEAIAEGRISVNGEKVTGPGHKADPDKDRVTCDGQAVVSERKRYIIMNKPGGVVCTTSDPEGRRTVIGLVKGIKESVKPVGRLDYNTTGLLILTNDGAFAQDMMRPASGIVKRYQAKVRGEVSQGKIKKMLSGLTIEKVKYRFKAVSVTRKTSGNTFLAISLTEGKKHHIKILCETLGNPVVKLARVGFGPLKLSGLGTGDYRHLSTDEVKALKRAVSHKRTTR
jgi:pseudouridine synthase